MATYYVANAGNDGNAGTMASPWKTTAPVNAVSFNPGDMILFNRGDTFRGYLQATSSGNVSNWITYGAYGTGNKPRIWGSKDASSTSDWVSAGGNMWRTAVTIRTDIANIIFNSTNLCGVKKTTLGACTVQGYFYINSSTSYVYLYSTSNPGTFYSHIELGGVYGENTIGIYSKSYIILENLDVRHSHNNGIILSEANNIIIQNNDILWCGGAYWSGATRMGNGIQMWEGNNNLSMMYNKIDRIYDAGISPQGEASYTMNNIMIQYNLITNCIYSFEMWTYVGQVVSNISIYNNTMRNAGSSWSEAQRPDPGNARHLMIWSLQQAVANFNIKNNIFDTCTEYALYCYFGVGSLLLDNNLWNVAFVADTNLGHHTTLAQWQVASGVDVNSVDDDPLFVSASDSHLDTGSPAAGIGVNLGLLLDLDGNTVLNPPAAGSYEYGGTPPASIPVTAVTVVGAGNETVITVNGGTLQMYAHIDPHDATDQTVTWSVINGTGSASISASGLLTAISNGTVTVKATSNG